jgi:hypothetical protein
MLSISIQESRPELLQAVDLVFFSYLILIPQISEIQSFPSNDFCLV